MLKIYVLVCATLLGFVSSECHHRDYGHGGTVCVCSEQAGQNCAGEFRMLLTGPATGIVSSYRSSLTGERFAHQQYQFTQTEPKSAHIIRVDINASERFQTIQGFGGAFTDSAGYNIAQMSPKLQTRILEDYFGEDGIGYTMARVPIGSTDFSLRGYSLADEPNDDTLAKFALAKEDIDYKIPFMKIANQLTNNTMKYFASAWSSPAWLKDNNKLTHGGYLLGNPGEKYYKIFADYLVKFLQEYQKRGVHFWGLTVLNEPSQGNSKTITYNALGLNATQQRDFIKLDLGPALEKAGYGADKIQLMVHDDNTPWMAPVVDTILADKDAAKYVGGVAFHWYSNGDAQQNAVLDKIAQTHPGTFLLATEACTLKPIELGSWAQAQDYAYDIINDLNHHSVGWIEWNLALDWHGGPSWVNNNFDDTLMVNSTAGEYYRQPTFYAMAHFAKFIIRDSVRIGHSVVWDETHENRSISVAVFERPDKYRVATVLNRANHPVKLHLHDPANGYLELDVTGNSIQSLIWHG